MTPADRIIDKFGGALALADLLGVNVTSIHRWTYPKSKKGTGGSIPTGRQKTLLELARAKGIKLRPADFFEAA